MPKHFIHILERSSATEGRTIEKRPSPSNWRVDGFILTHTMITTNSQPTVSPTCYVTVVAVPARGSMTINIEKAKMTKGIGDLHSTCAFNYHRQTRNQREDTPELGSAKTTLQPPLLSHRERTSAMF